MDKTFLLAFAVFLSALIPRVLAQESGHEESKPYYVVLDAGHGGGDEGIQKEGLSEKQLALGLASRIQTLLKNRTGVEAVTTRKADYALSFDERRKIANTHNPGLFLSLHFAGAPSPAAHGSRIFILGGSSITDARLLVPIEQAHVSSVSSSLKLASFLSEELRGVSPDTKTQVSEYPLASLVGVTIPAVLIEADFLTHSQSTRWKDPATSDIFANAIVAAIDRFIAERNTPQHETTEPP